MPEYRIFDPDNGACWVQGDDAADADVRAGLMKGGAMNLEEKHTENALWALRSLLEKARTENAGLRARVAELEHERDRTISEMEGERDTLLEALTDVIAQACYTEDVPMDSFAISAYEAGIELLARYGRVALLEGRGRIMARWPQERTMAKGETDAHPSS